jgi:hypothetical protein
MATNWPPADEIDACNDDVVIEITHVIAGNKISTEYHLILSVDLFGLKPKQTGSKNYGSHHWLTHRKERRRGFLDGRRSEENRRRAALDGTGSFGEEEQRLATAAYPYYASWLTTDGREQIDSSSASIPFFSFFTMVVHAHI